VAVSVGQKKPPAPTGLSGTSTLKRRPKYGRSALSSLSWLRRGSRPHACTARLSPTPSLSTRQTGFSARVDRSPALPHACRHARSDAGDQRDGTTRSEHLPREARQLQNLSCFVATVERHLMDFAHLSPTDFENLTFDLLQAAGLKGLIWRTPGADGGRDIEGTLSVSDFSNYYHQQKWYIECKRYSSSIDWPTVWSKVAYAEGRDADFLLLVTNSNPSPTCENEIAAWNARNGRLLIRVWRGYELGNILSNYPSVGAKYGLIDRLDKAEMSLQTLMLEAMKLAQSSYVAHHLGLPIASSLEANAALAELVSARQSQLRQYGRITPNDDTTAPSYDWLTWSGTQVGWDEVGIRALLAMIKHTTGARTIEAVSEEKKANLKLVDVRFPMSAHVERILSEIAIWADLEIAVNTECAMVLRRR